MEFRKHRDTDGVVWYVAKDICNYLNIKNTSKAFRDVPWIDKKDGKVQTTGGKQLVLLITRSAMINFLIKKEAFKLLEDEFGYKEGDVIEVEQPTVIDKTVYNPDYQTAKPNVGFVKYIHNVESKICLILGSTDIKNIPMQLIPMLQYELLYATPEFITEVANHIETSINKHKLCEFIQPRNRRYLKNFKTNKVVVKWISTIPTIFQNVPQNGRNIVISDILKKYFKDIYDATINIDGENWKIFLTPERMIKIYSKKRVVIQSSRQRFITPKSVITTVLSDLVEVIHNFPTS